MCVIHEYSALNALKDVLTFEATKSAALSL